MRLGLVRRPRSDSAQLCLAVNSLIYDYVRLCRSVGLRGNGIADIGLINLSYATIIRL